MHIPAVTTEQMVEVDRLMIGEYGISLIQMMENAGRDLAELAVRFLGDSPVGKRIVVACGLGNNGGGGMVAARHLHNRGANVQIGLTGDVGSLKSVPAQQWQILQKIGIDSAWPADLAGADLILDALIGYGLQGNPRPPVSMWIESLNASGAPVLALDVPSGLDSTTGQPGTPAVRATATMTLALPKKGLFAPQAQAYVGELYLADIGVPPELYRRLGIDLAPIFTRTAVISISGD